MEDGLTKAVLDKGYVRLEDFLGTDLTPVNAARASYRKKSSLALVCPGCGNYMDGRVPDSVDIVWCVTCEDYVRPAYKLKKKDKGLLRFLGREGHTSPFRHALLQFEVRAPLMVARQWWKYVVGSAHGPTTLDWLNVHEAMGIDGEGIETPWNETSGRYVTQEWEFYVPKEWRKRAETNKQGSGGPMDEGLQARWHETWKDVRFFCFEAYKKALRDDMAPEMARLFLPYAALYTNWYWTASLQTVAWFVVQRHPGYLGAHAQWEIQQYAIQVEEIARHYFPQAFGELVEKFKDGGPEAKIERLQNQVEELMERLAKYEEV